MTKNWKLKDILFMAISAAVFGVIYLGFVYVGGGITAALTPAGWGPFGYTPFYGIFFICGISHANPMGRVLSGRMWRNTSRHTTIYSCGGYTIYIMMRCLSFLTTRCS